MPKTNMHPDAVGNGSLSQTFTQKMVRVSTTDGEYMIGLSYSTEVYPGSSPGDMVPKAGKITVAGSGSANTADITLSVESQAGTSGDDNSDTDFVISVAAAKVDWSSGAASAYTVKDVIDLINEDDAGGTDGKLLQGYSAWIMDAPYDLEINAANALVTAAESYVMSGGGSGSYTKALQRDISEHVINTDEKVYYKRIGFPEPRDNSLFKFVDLWGTQTGTTSGEVTIYRDQLGDFVEPVGAYATDLGNHEILYSLTSTSLSANRGTTPGVPSGGLGEPEVFRGPVLLAIQASNLTAADVRIAMQAVSY